MNRSERADIIAQMRSITFIVTLVFLFATAASAEKIPVSPALTESFIIPKGKTEMGVGGDFTQKRSGEEWYINPMIFFRYGWKDGLEILPLGVRWLALDDRKNRHQLALKARLAGLNDSGGADSFYSWEAAAEGRFHFQQELALTYYAGNYRTEYTRGGFAEAFGLGGGALISMGGQAAMEVSYTHEFQQGLGSASGDSVAAVFYWTPEPDTRLSLATTSNLMPRNDAFRFGHIGDINQVWTLGITWKY